MPDSADVVSHVLDRMERQARTTKLTILYAAGVEGIFLAIALSRMNWADDTHVLIFVLSVLTYTIVALGLFALGAHVSRVGTQIVAALDDRARR